MLPRFAATVMMIRVNISFLFSPKGESTIIAKGTSVTSETSFVRNMLKKKAKSDIRRLIPLYVFTLERSLFVRTSKVPICPNAATISIRLKRIARTLKLIYPIYCISGRTNKHETAARNPEINRIGLFFIMLVILLIFPPMTKGRFYIISRIMKYVKFNKGCPNLQRTPKVCSTFLGGAANQGQPV